MHIKSSSDEYCDNEYWTRKDEFTLFLTLSLHMSNSFTHHSQCSYTPPYFGNFVFPPAVGREGRAMNDGETYVYHPPVSKILHNTG